MFCYSFLIIPGYTFALSLAGSIAIYVGLMPLLAILVISMSITVVQVNMSSRCLANFKVWGLGPWQKKYPKVLPKILRSWDFLPEFMRSLAPYDRFHWHKIVKILKYNSRIFQIYKQDILLEERQTKRQIKWQIRWSMKFIQCIALSKQVYQSWIGKCNFK